MKRTMKILLLPAIALLATACEMDKLNPSLPEEADELGYLMIGKVSTNADTEVGELNGSTAAVSRAVTDAPDTYYLEIVNSLTAATVWSGTIAELNAYTEGLGVEPGKYKVYAYQTSAKAPAAGAALDAPYYSGVSQEIEVVKKQTSTFRVTCRLANIKTSVELSADLKTMFDTTASAAEPLQVDVKVGTASLTNNYIYPYTATHDAGPYAYFADVAGPDAQAGNTLTFTLTGMFYTGDPVDAMNGTIDASKWKAVKMQKSLTGVKAAQWRKISIDIDHQTTGDVQFIITIQSLIYDEEIVVDLTTLYADEDELGLDQEEAIPDEDEQNPDAPDVAIDGQSELTFAINSSIYDADAQSWTKYLKVNITPKDGTTVKQLYAVFASDNAALLTNMAAKGFVEGRVDLFPTNAASTYANVAADGTKVTLNATGMDALYRYAGTHTVKFFTVDSDNRMKSTELTITVAPGGAAANGPTVVWLIDGENVIDQTHTLTSENYATYPCLINITSTTGITKFEVDIISPSLDSAELQEVGLDTHIDMVSPGSMLKALQSLQLMPAGKETLAGETDVPFNISNFFGALYSIHAKNADCVFKLTVADSTGEVVKDVKFYIAE